MLVGPDVQPPSRPPYLGGGGGAPQPATVGKCSQSTLRTPRCRSLDVFDSRTSEGSRDGGGRQSSCAIAWMGDGVIAGPPAPSRPRSAAPSPRRASVPCAPSTIDNDEGPPGKLPLGDRLRHQSPARSSHPNIVGVAGAPRTAAISLSSSSQRRVVHDAEYFGDPNSEDMHRLQPVIMQFPGSANPSEEARMVHCSGSGRPMYTCSSLPVSSNEALRSHSVCMAPVSAEEAALAAGALAELRASVALAAGKLESLEAEFMEEARQRQDLSRAFSQHKKKQAEALSQLGVGSGSNEKISARIDQVTSEWSTKQTQVDSHILSLEQLCRHLQESVKSVGDRVERAEERPRHNSRLEALERSVFEACEGHRGLDSRVAGLERNLSNLQMQIGATSENITTLIQNIPQQNEAIDHMRNNICSLEEAAQRQGELTGTCQGEVDKLQEQEFELHEKCSRLENERSELTMLIKQLDSRLNAQISETEAGRSELLERVGEGDRRVKEVENSHKNLIEKCDEIQSSQQSSDSQEYMMSWDVEKHFRSIAEEISSVAEQSMATYVEASRAELLEQIDALSKRWSKAGCDISPKSSDSMVLSQTEFDAGNSIVSDMPSDFQVPTSQSFTVSGLDVWESCAERSCKSASGQRKSRWPPRQGPEVPQREQVDRPTQHAGATLSRSASEAKSSSVVSASHSNMPVWRPSGVASHTVKSPSNGDLHAIRHIQPPNAARRLRSSSPVKVYDGTTCGGPVVRPPSIPRNCEVLAG